MPVKSDPGKSSVSKKSMECGIDEAGRGPVIGPMVMSLVCADPDILRDMGVRDSKTLTRTRREELFQLIHRNAKKIEFHVIDVVDLNREMETKTLNEIELDHASNLALLAEDGVVVDCFDVDEGRASNAMSKRTGRRVMCVHKADRDFPAVSAASIISKVIRDREIDKIKEKYGDIGSGYPSDPATRSFLEKAFSQNIELKGIIRTHWSTVKEISRKVRTKGLF